MKNLFRKLLLLLVFIFLFSCEKSEDNKPKSSFFNLNVGSKWVYKRYQSLNNSPFEFSGIVDTVKIVSIENIQGFLFAKTSSKKVNTNYGTVDPIVYSYLRINNEGHLIEINNINNIGNLKESSGVVIHPGNDLNFTYDKEVKISEEVLGIVKFLRFDEYQLTLEGNSYLVLPFNGIFTPSLNHPELISKTGGVEFSQNIGLIRSVYFVYSGSAVFEERLVSYQLN